MAGRKSDFTLTKLDDLFTTQAQRDEEQLSKIRDIPLELIDDFPDHPFKVRDDEDMMQLVESVKERGVITPATVRQKEDGRYELVSGHRRKRACELAGFETLRSEIVDLNRDEATILMVESNFQRSEILPSEKAFAYKMRLEAMKRQAGRPSKENGVPVGHNSIVGKSREILASESQDSNTQIQRYVRLTNLVPELLEFVDEGRIKMRPAVELSYLDEDCQRDVVDEIDLNDATPSHDQTIRMRKLFNEGNLTTEVIHAVMSEEKPNQKEKIVLRGDRVRQLIPKNIPVSQTEDFVCKALEHYNKFFRKYCVKDKKSDEPDNKTELSEGYEEGMILASVKAEKSTHYTSPPKMFTEDTLLAAMETAGNKEFDSETEKKGLGTPATRANIIEKLVSSGYAERKGKQILPTVAGCELIHVMPENLKSASLTAEWENLLLMMEKGKIQEDEFMNGIVSMINEILSLCRAIPEEERNRFQTAREVIGKCPVCGSDVYEGKTNYYCSDRSCQFALWKSNRFLESMKKSMDKKMAVELLKKGRTHVKGLYSKKKDSKFDADLVLGVEEGKARFSLEFPKKKK
ncbi:ParB/RepB/Spo0J family partition protein [bacterium TM473]|nr:ParB/RepB/Spo0J family partition protein [bacterium TM473]